MIDKQHIINVYSLTSLGRWIYLWCYHYKQDSGHTSLPKPLPALQNSSLPLLLDNAQLNQMTTDLLSLYISFHFSKISYKWNHRVCTPFACLSSLWIIILSFIHVVVCNNNPFIFIAEQYAIVWLYHSLFYHSAICDICIFPSFGYCKYSYYALSWTSAYEHVLSFSLGKYLGGKCLG